MMVVDRAQRAKSDVSYHLFPMDNHPVDPFDILLLNSLILHPLAKQQQRFISILMNFLQYVDTDFDHRKIIPREEHQKTTHHSYAYISN